MTNPKPRELYMKAINGEVTFHDVKPKGNCITWIEKSAYDSLKEELEMHKSQNLGRLGIENKYTKLQAQADKLVEALADVIYGEPPDFATKYVYADKLLKEYRGEK